ncbi:tetratricopeptide repeat protein [Herminiimonas arsenitoxidans]|uniref:tetratricopeptide repeat protein n=1 Tax=Herminiimonas arsenitoxidans TaxID=1809410 RepID=UPI001E5E34D1|nr:tetratricopeptide repeat protein [Herminiimonas arsenitoxidans]
MKTTAYSLPMTKEELDALPVEHWQELLSGAPEVLVEWLTAAAALDDCNAQALLGQMLLDGNGVTPNTSRAYACFVAASEQQQAMAMNMRGRCLEHGWGTQIDPVAAAHWYRSAAEAGLDWGMYNYANLLSRGRGVELNQELALDWYRKAAGMGHAKSLNLVGRYYEEGIVVEASRSTAFNYYRDSALAGDFRGQYSYACMLAERGRIDEATRWLEKIPATATIAFMNKIGNDLLLSAHPSFRAFAEKILAKDFVTLRMG